jgi:hypothetical protein
MLLCASYQTRQAATNRLAAKTGRNRHHQPE